MGRGLSVQQEAILSNLTPGSEIVTLHRAMLTVAAIKLATGHHDIEDVRFKKCVAASTSRAIRRLVERGALYKKHHRTWVIDADYLWYSQDETLRSAFSIG